ncbi:MAG TPA: hypothetical protein VML55_08285 [Planctomycetaceae bacterium]|nr:hypothetical protein [Planctomycetaceae bacterium]
MLRLRLPSIPFALAALGLAAAGCHELQPHRLQRLNRGSGLSPEAYYSVADPAVETGGGGWQLPVARGDSAGRHETVGALPLEPSGDRPPQ